MLKECFVAQCFDNGVYDRRYRETFAPAIQDAGATPVRADEKLGTIPIIETIEKSLRRSAVAFAEVSENNPNVFLELGYALALGVPTVIACDRAKRSKLPFDIQHRPIIFYSAEAQSDFDKLRIDVTNNITAALSEAAEKLRPSSLMSNSADEDSVDTVKRLCLLELLDQDLRSPDGSSLWQLQKGTVNSEVSERMVALAITGLIAEGYVEKRICTDQDGDNYSAISLSDQGRKLVMREYAALMKEEKERLKQQNPFHVGMGDEVPF